MAEAADVDRWDHTAAIIATVVGLVDKSARVEKFHPYRRKAAKRGVPLTSENLKSLKGVFERKWGTSS